MRVLFMGHQTWATKTLDALVRSKHKVVGVVAEKDEFDKNYFWDGEYESVKSLAKKHGLPVFQPEDVNNENFLKTIKKLNPEIIVIVSYHKIIGNKILKKYSVINAHGSLLPKYRGRAPINWAIINGETKTGVTVHYVAETLDSGDILVQEEVPIDINETAGEVFEKTIPLYPKLVLKALDMIENGKFKTKQQDESIATQFPKRNPEDGKIILNKFKTAKQLHDFIRAQSKPYPGAFFEFKDGSRVYVLKSEIRKSRKI